MKYRNPLIVLLVLVIGGLALHQLLTSITETAKIKSVRVLNAALTQVQDELDLSHPSAPRDRDTPPTTADPCAVWRDLFTRLRPIRQAFKNGLPPAALVVAQVRWGEKEYDGLTEDDLETLAAFVAENDPLIEDIRIIAADSTSVCRFGPVCEQDFYWLCDDLLSTDMLYRRAVGEFEVVVRDVIGLCTISQADPFIDYPFLMHRGTQQCLRDAIESGTIDDAAWSTLLRQLTVCRDHQQFVDGWSFTVQDCLKWYDDPPAHMATRDPDSQFWFLLAVGYRYGATPLMNHHVTRFSDVMADLLPLAPLPYYEIAGDLHEIANRYDIVPPWELPPITDPGWWLVSTLVHERFDGRAGVEAEIDLARIAINLERFHREHGQYPDTLEPLAADFGGELPLNPYLGQPYRYELDPGIYRLWYEYELTNQDGTTERWLSRWPGEGERLDPAQSQD